MEEGKTILLPSHPLYLEDVDTNLSKYVGRSSPPPLPCLSYPEQSFIIHLISSTERPVG